MNKAVVSIIIPVYNPPKFLFKRCMDSIIHQSYKDIEILVIDDGSDKEIADEIDKLSEKDSRIHVIHQINSGVSAARNRGIDSAIGKYICFVDADDCISKNWIETAVNFSEKRDIDIVYGKVIMCTESPNESSQKIKSNIKYKVFEQDKLWQVQKYLLLNNAYPPLPDMDYLDLGSCGKLIKKSVINDARLPEDISLAEDQVFNHRILTNCKRCMVCNADSYYYVQNLSSVSHTYQPCGVEIMVNAMEKIKLSLVSEIKLKNSYYFNVLINFWVALSLQYFQIDSPKTNIINKIAKIRKELNRPLIKEARKNIIFKELPRSKSVIKTRLKYRLWILFVLYKSARLHKLRLAAENK